MQAPIPSSDPATARAGAAPPSARPRRPAAGRRLGGLCLAALCLSGSAALADRRVVVGHDGRIPEAAAALRLSTSPDLLAERHAATGVVECGGVRGIGQLTGRADVVTSAAHVFFDESGRSRAERGRCVFILTGAAGRTEVALTPDPRLCGSTSPYGEDARRDWAVAHLARPIPGVVPYAVGASVKVGEPITVVALESGRRTFDFCRVRELRAAAGGGREILTDCVGFDGLSGAAYLVGGAHPRVIGVHVGFRSRAPDVAAPFAADHHTFGTALDGAFGRAVATSTR
ncbi:hypothetical protein EYW49_10265 [Siculibacillus lacustris]|uniref:Serine protease n=1 Tax=Siculibacillus lacustris TaxID=1549641 RepID=A0A4Q9VSG8_9HYPH|nr:hypothetical protein [Siculibacillus lacustris]TBW37988.1 hypothetical protein EYW49_10265 [Siculibacillus lacustris]